MPTSALTSNERLNSVRCGLLSSTEAPLWTTAAFRAQARDYVLRTEFVARNAEFMEKGVAKVAAAAKLRQVKAAEAEMLHLDAELVEARRDRLKQFYAEEYRQLQIELQARGLSLPF